MVRAQHDHESDERPRPVAPWQISVCGEVTVTAPGGEPRPVRGRQPQLVLAHLAVERRAVLRDELAELLWGDGRLPDHWPGAVRGVLSKVRAALEEAGAPPGALAADSGVVTLTLPGDWQTDLDLAADDADTADRLLRRLTDQGRQATGEAALAAARRARRTIAGPLLPAADGDWVRRLGERAAAVAAEAARTEVEALLALDRPAEAVDVAAARVAFEPLDEVAHHQLVRGHLASGRRVAARRAFDDLRRILTDELGIAPAAATAALLAEPEPDPSTASGPDTAGGGASATADGAAADRSIDDDRFVGRSAELEQLHEAWAATVASGRPRLVVVEGQTGIGKTRLATELAQRLATDGAAQLWGRCRPTSGLAYEPVVDALRRRAEAEGPDLVARLGDAAAGLLRLAPELGTGDATHHADDPDVARTTLFREVATTVAALAATPTVWVIDDLQWASDDTMALLEVVLDGLERPLLMLATGRNIPAVVADGLARLQRLVPVTTVALTGLSETELLPMLVGLPGGRDRAASLDLARALHRRTGGHPFFLAEITREARRQGSIEVDETPEAARLWVRRRAESLPPPVASRLDLASVIGLEVDLEVMARCTSDPADQVLDRLEELVQLGFLAEADDPGTFTFPHQITRDVVYERLGGTRRARLHRSVAEALEAGPEHPNRTAALAHHHARAGRAGRRPAVAFAVAAARQSLDRSAWGLAADQLEAALHLTDDEVQRARVLVPLGIARHRLRQPEEARSLLVEAVELARRHRLPVELAEAAVHLVGRGGRGAALGMPDSEQAGLLREALALLAEPEATAAGAPGGEAGLGGRPGLGTGFDGSEAVAETAARRELLAITIEGELALALLFTGGAEERHDLVLQALERVRSRPSPEPAHLTRALLNARLAKERPERLAERLADLDQVLALPADRLPPESTIAAHAYRHEEHLRAGDRSAARADLARARALADANGHPFWRWAVTTWESMALVIDGHLDEAEALLMGSLSLQGGSPPEALACLGVQLVDIRLFQDRAGEVVDVLAATAEASPLIPCYRAVLALCRLASGDRAGAEADYRPFRDQRFSELPEDSNRFLALAVLGDVAADLADPRGARDLTELLLPYRDQHVLLNCYGGGGAYWGPTTRILGRLAAVDGRLDDARRCFGEAEARAEAFGAPLAADRVRRDARAALA